MKIYNWNTLSNLKKQSILRRPPLPTKDNIKIIQTIIQEVKNQGDQALVDLTKKYDHIALDKFEVTQDEIQLAFYEVNVEAKRAILFAKEQIERHHEKQVPENLSINSYPGVLCERQVRPIERVGLYIPGGTAPLISTVLMLAIPAQIAECKLRILCTPPNQEAKINPHILVAATLCGISHIYKLGGAQAIAAMAYGTNTIPKVEKIFGPGNSWVTEAKLLVSQDPQGASIDMPAGPSELMVIADSHANIQYVAADLLSQAEHGVDSQVMLVTPCEKLANDIENVINAQLKELPRANIAKQSLSQSRSILVNDITQAISVSNAYAPEHLILQVENAKKYVPLIENAGAVFLGPWTPETLGDYVMGSNHVLPTYGYARSFSGLSILDFIKFISVQSVNREGFEKLAPYAEKLAELKGLDAHRKAVALRLAEMVES